MVKEEIIKTGKVLRGLLQERGIGVNKIIVFGSYVKGLEKKDSDIDIIVVSNNFRNKDIFGKIELTRGVHRELVREIKKPVDLIYYSDMEWDKGCSLIISSAKKEGRFI